MGVNGHVIGVHEVLWRFNWILYWDLADIYWVLVDI